jgi:hypothetical protein
MSLAELDLGTLSVAPLSECIQCGACKCSKGDFVQGFHIRLERNARYLEFNLCGTEKPVAPPTETAILDHIRFLLALPRRFDDYLYYGVRSPMVGKAMAVLHIQARRLFSVEERALILKGSYPGAGAAPSA